MTFLGGLSVASIGVIFKGHDWKKLVANGFFLGFFSEIQPTKSQPGIPNHH